MVPLTSNESGPDEVGKYYIKNIITGKYLWLNGAQGVMGDGKKALFIQS